MVAAMLAAVALWFAPAHIVTHAPWKVRPKQQVVVVQSKTPTPYGSLYQSAVFLVWRTRFWRGCADPFRFHGRRYCWAAHEWGYRLDVKIAR